MNRHRWVEDRSVRDGMGGYRTMCCSVCGRPGWLCHGERRDGTVEVGREPMHADFSGVVGSSIVSTREFTDEERDCDLERVRQVQES